MVTNYVLMHVIGENTVYTVYIVKQILNYCIFGESSSRRTHQSHNHYYVDDSLFEHPNGGGHPNLAAQKSHPGREREREIGSVGR